MPPDMLAIEGLRAGYGEAVVLPGLSLRLAEGQVLALLGRNGTGKTTLINSSGSPGGSAAPSPSAAAISRRCGRTSGRAPGSAGCRRSAISFVR
jgi:ABC-type molybdenum transport system ATPase subunit/photorepair protein PhrA